LDAFSLDRLQVGFGPNVRENWFSGRVTRCVCEKIAQDVAQSILCHNKRKYQPWKKEAAKLGLL
jgi:hypothetical protein